MIPAAAAIANNAGEITGAPVPGLTSTSSSLRSGTSGSSSSTALRTMALISVSSVMFLPLIISIFFLAQHLKSKSGIWQNIYKVLNFVSIALFCYIVVIIIVSFLG